MLVKYATLDYLRWNLEGKIYVMEEMAQREHLCNDFRNKCNSIHIFLRWMAPEVMMGQEFNEKADVYSFGLILVKNKYHNTYLLLYFFHESLVVLTIRKRTVRTIWRLARIFGSNMCSSHPPTNTDGLSTIVIFIQRLNQKNFNSFVDYKNSW